MNAVTVLSVVAACLAVIVSVITFLSGARVRRNLYILQSRTGKSDLLTAVAHQAEQVGMLRNEIKNLITHVSSLQGVLKGTTQCVFAHRFDAFDDMGGQLSFSAAILDANGDGIVISSINGRTDARTYAKPVEGGQSTFDLSPEELEAIKRAAERRVV